MSKTYVCKFNTSDIILMWIFVIVIVFIILCMSARIHNMQMEINKLQNESLNTVATQPVIENNKNK